MKLLRSTLGLAMLNVMLIGGLSIATPAAGAEEEAMYARTCVCAATEGNECVRWESTGCPRAKVQTCNAACGS